MVHLPVRGVEADIGRLYCRPVGLLLSLRRLVGLRGPDDRGVSSALRNYGQIERYGTIIEPAPFERPPQAPLDLEEGELPWELREPGS